MQLELGGYYLSIKAQFQYKVISKTLFYKCACMCIPGFSCKSCYNSLSPIFRCGPRKLNCSFMCHMEPKICRFLLLPSPPPGDFTDKHTFSLRGRTNPTYLCLKHSFHSTQKAGFVSASGLCCGLFGGCTQRSQAGGKPAALCVCLRVCSHRNE